MCNAFSFDSNWIEGFSGAKCRGIDDSGMCSKKISLINNFVENIDLFSLHCLTLSHALCACVCVLFHLLHFHTSVLLCRCMLWSTFSSQWIQRVNQQDKMMIAMMMKTNKKTMRRPEDNIQLKIYWLWKSMIGFI